MTCLLTAHKNTKILVLKILKLLKVVNTSILMKNTSILHALGGELRGCLPKTEKSVVWCDMVDRLDAFSKQTCSDYVAAYMVNYQRLLGVGPVITWLRTWSIVQ